jgi:two-component system, OmpR family, phosphate regulon sensor histidine kinase PhoR
MISFRWKLLGSYLLLILLLGGGLYLYLDQRLAELQLSVLQGELLTEAKLAVLVAEGGVRELTRDAPAIAASLGRAGSARVTIIDREGRVVGDSEVPPAGLGELENHLDRPEVRTAFTKGLGQALRYSATLKTDMLYVATSFYAPNGPAVVRLALPLATLSKAEAQMTTLLGAGLVTGLILAMLFSFIFSRLMSRPLRLIADSAMEIGRGNFRQRLAVNGSDEVSDVARVMNDMSSRIESQMEKLEREKGRLDAILRGMGEGLMVTDAAGAITLVNPAFCELFGVSATVVGRPLIEIARFPDLNACYREASGARTEYRREIVTSGSRERVLLTHWVPLMDQQKHLGVVAVFHDISDLKRLEKIRKDFVANVSHELKTPVTVIKGYAEALLEGLVTSDPQRAINFIEIIRNHSDRQAELIGNLLTLSELESETFSLELHPFDLAGAARRAVTFLGDKSVERGVTIVMTGFVGLPPVLMDPSRIEQVFVNLLDNAIRYTPGGGKVELSALAEAERVVVTVRDYGQGIPPQSLSRIFERFYRVDEGRSREEGGNGLGLAIVKHLVQLHGGTVSVESTPGHGSAFSFTLRAN